MSDAEIEAFFAALARPAASVISAHGGVNLAVGYEPPQRKGNHTARRPKRKPVGRGVCSFCRQVRIVAEVHDRLCCARCP